MVASEGAIDDCRGKRHLALLSVVISAQYHLDECNRNRLYIKRAGESAPLLACTIDFNRHPPLQDTMVFCPYLCTNVSGKVLRLHPT